MFTKSLGNLKIASPCPSNWNEMYGDDRVRFCSECKLSVYNLSGMSRTEAETLLMKSEGRLCVRFYRRKDGTVITRDCPVGWGAIKARARRSASAFASIVLGFLAGLFGVRATESAISIMPMGDVRAIEVQDRRDGWIAGESTGTETDAMPEVGQPWLHEDDDFVVGRVDRIQEFKDARVKAWVK